MSNSIQRISFGQIDNSPVVVGQNNHYIYDTTNRRWRDLPEPLKQEVIPIKSTTFLRRFGKLVDQLPNELRDIARPLRIATESDKMVGYCRSGLTRYFEPTATAGVVNFTAPIVSAEVTPIEPFLAKRQREQCTFDLGRHQYSGGPGFSWTCEYRIVRLDDDGHEWDVLATSEESEGYESMGIHSLEAAQEYFESVGFHISRESWEAIGAKFPVEEPEDEDELYDDCFQVEDE